MKKGSEIWAAAVAVTAIIWGVSGYFAGQYIAFRLAGLNPGPPSAIHGIQVERPDIEPGGLITYTMQATRLRGECVLLGRDHYLRAEDGEDIFLSRREPAEQLRAGQQIMPDIWIDVPVSHDISGAYRFFVDLSYQCPDESAIRHVYSPFRVVRVD